MTTEKADRDLLAEDFARLAADYLAWHRRDPTLRYDGFAISEMITATLRGGYKRPDPHRHAPTPWGPLPEIDPDGPMCSVVNGNILCCRTKGHSGRHATPFPSQRRHGPVWVYWVGGGPFGSCHHGDPATHLYCGLEAAHEGDHLAPSNQGSGCTLAEWAAPREPIPQPPPRTGEAASQPSTSLPEDGRP